MIKINREYGVPIRYRQGTTDENVIKEVIGNRVYRRSTANFDVEQGEHWLDLGANIGAFAVYCKLREATAECYEPDTDCFNLLLKNASGFNCHNKAVTACKDSTVKFYNSSTAGNYARGSIIKKGRMNEAGSVPNKYVGEIRGHYDGIKMDIEGSEFGLLDGDLLPSCNKLVMEYHSSRDSSRVNLKRRLHYLRSKFDFVAYPPELDRIVAGKGKAKTFYDRFIFCWNS